MIDWGATAAWAQAFLTGGAVFAAAWLQDRAIARRDGALRKQRLEEAATAARYANSKVQRIRSGVTDGMDGLAVLRFIPEGVFNGAVRGLEEIKLSQLGDVELIEAFLTLHEQFWVTSGAVQSLRVAALNNKGMAVDGAALLGNEVTRFFNAAAGVERRVAQLVGRKPLL